MGKKEFHEILREALFFVLSMPKTWLFGLLFGGLAVFQHHVLAPFFPSSQEPSQFLGALRALSPEQYLWAGALLLGIFLLRLLGKANLIWLLGHTAAPDSPEEARDVSSVTDKLSPSLLFRNFLSLLLLELGFFGFFLVIVTILALPPLAASVWNEAAIDPLLLFSALACVSLFLIALLVKELALFYRILGRLSVRASFENAYLLFGRFTGRALLFGAYVLGLILLFTFFLDLLILTFGAIGLGVASPALSVLFLGALGLLSQALWFFFFRDLALPKGTALENKGEVLSVEVPSSPSINQGV